MEYRNLAQSDLKLSVITSGSWVIGGGMWGKANRNDAIAAIQASYQLGVTSIDTAPIYGAGASDEIVAEAIQGYPRDKVQILTKYRPPVCRRQSGTAFGFQSDTFQHGKPGNRC